VRRGERQKPGLRHTGGLELNSRKNMAQQTAPPTKEKNWREKLSRSGYFFGALLFHLIVFVMIATWVIFPAFHPPTDDFDKTFVPPSSPPPPPPSQPAVSVPTQAVSTPTTTITSPTATPVFNVPIPNITPDTTPDVTQKMTQQVPSKSNVMSDSRLASIMETEKAWSRDKQNILESDSDPRNVVAKFPVYLASYADGDWGCNVHLTGANLIDAGSLPNLVAKMNEWSRGNLKGEVVPTPLNIGSSELLDKKPPFIFFTGHKDFVLTDQEVQNLRDYLQIGGCIWGDNALAGRGSRFDVAFRREMKRVVPDLDKNFEPVPMNHKIFTKSWFPISKIPPGMNYYAEPIEHLDIDGEVAILYTLNDYSDMFWMRILPGDTDMQGFYPDPNSNSPLFTFQNLLLNKDIFYRNFELPSCLACDQLGMNIIGYLLVRFDDKLQLTP
jgi:hypothetical protein